METLSFHLDGNFFLMAGRLFKGKWNAALFDHDSGSKVHEQNIGFRISSSTFTPDGKTLYLADGANQGNSNNKRNEAGLLSTKSSIDIAASSCFWSSRELGLNQANLRRPPPEFSV